jgi:Ser/Thr protein kinase RdoA (MazF antagonist)
MAPAEFPSEIVAVLRRYSRQVSVWDITALEPFSGFSGARVWKITVPPTAWALRCWPVPGLSPARILGLHRLLEHLSRSGLSCVAVPVFSDSGETSVTSSGRLWQLEPWLPGTADYHKHANPQRLKAALTSLGRWHLAAARFVPTSQEREWFGSSPGGVSPAVSERLARLRGISPRILADLRNRVLAGPHGEQQALCLDLCRQIPLWHSVVAGELAAVQREPFALQPCLRDIWHDHVLFTGDEVSGLIDPSACRMENVAADLARLIGSLVEDDADGWRIALDAYRQMRPLSLAEEALTAVLDRSGILLSAVTWLEWLYRDDRTFSNPRAVMARLRQLHRRLAGSPSRRPIW